MGPTVVEIAARLALALVAGGALGLERQWHGKPAGLRTHMMVSLGAAAFVLITLELYDAAIEAGGEHMRLDPLRLMQGLVGGIGFLGAGSILRQGDSVEGLTTAASVWIAGALGAACGGGHYVIAGLTTAFGLIVLLALGALEHRIDDEEGPPNDEGSP